MILFNFLWFLGLLLASPSSTQNVGKNFFLRKTTSAGPVTCPTYLYVYRHVTNFNITCTLTGLSKVREATWTIPSVYLPNKIQPGETHGSFTFEPLQRINKSTTLIVLTLSEIDSSVDYDVYTLTVRVPRGFYRPGAYRVHVRLYERGQGKAPFQWWDYLIFGIILAISASIGVYYGFFDKSANTQTEYMLGGRQMSWVPVTLSLLASFMSAITLLGTPSEVYVFGTQYLLIGLGYPFVMLIAAHIFLPTFYNLRLTSTYEYLEMRFSKAVRVAGAAIFVVQMVLYMAMVVYMPSIALESVTGLNFWFSALTTAVVCIFYTSMGGMKATMWTDAFQVCMMAIGLVAIMTQGCIREGGFLKAWDKAASRGRTEFFNVDPDPKVRHSFWTVTIGGIFTWAYTYSVNQAQVQRGLSAKSLKTAQFSLWINVPGLILMMLIPGLCGILIFSRYMDCDPLRTGLISKRDQLFIFYVMDIVSEDLPGIPGLFMATLFSAALSTLSSGINGLAAVTCRDFGVEALLRSRRFSESSITWIAKIISVLYGALCIALISIIQYLPGILDSALGLFGALGGPLFGIYVCGLLVPWINSLGALAGLISALLMTVWITVGDKANPQVSKAQRALSLSTMSCDVDFVTSASSAGANVSSVLGSIAPERPLDFSRLSGLENLYSLSYLYLGIVGILVSFTVGIIVSAFTGWTRNVELPPVLIHPVVVRLADRFNIKTWLTPDDKEQPGVIITAVNNKKTLVRKTASTTIYPSEMVFSNKETAI